MNGFQSVDVQSSVPLNGGNSGYSINAGVEELSKISNNGTLSHQNISLVGASREASPPEKSGKPQLQKSNGNKPKSRLPKNLFEQSEDFKRQDVSALESYTFVLQYMLLEQLDKNKKIFEKFQRRFRSLASLLVDQGVNVAMIEEVLQDDQAFEFQVTSQGLAKQNGKLSKLLRKMKTDPGPMEKAPAFSTELESPEIEHTIMEEILKNEKNFSDSASNYLEFLKNKILDVPVPAKLEPAIRTFKAKYNIIKQRETSKSALPAQSFEVPASAGNINSGVLDSKNVDLAKQLKGRKGFAIPIKRQSSKKPKDFKASNSQKDMLAPRKRDMKKQPGEKKQRGRKKQNQIASFASFDKNKELYKNQQAEIVNAPLPIIPPNDRIFLSQGYGAVPPVGTYTSLVEPSYALQANHGNMMIPPSSSPNQILPNYLDSDAGYFGQQGLLGKRSSIEMKGDETPSQQRADSL